MATNPHARRSGAPSLSRAVVCGLQFAAARLEVHHMCTGASWATALPT